MLHASSLEVGDHMMLRSALQHDLGHVMVTSIRPDGHIVGDLSLTHSDVEEADLLQRLQTASDDLSFAVMQEVEAALSAAKIELYNVTRQTLLMIEIDFSGLVISRAGNSIAFRIVKPAG